MPNENTGTDATGGTAGSGGTVGNGGSTSNGGTVVGNGGSVGSGGNLGTGGTSPGSGGSVSSGGSTSSGSAANSGGATSTGGSANSGGSTSNSGGSTSSGGSANSGGSTSSGGAGSVDRFTLVVDAPANNSTVQGNSVNVRGRGPGFMNVEVWDAQHTSPPLGRVTPGADGAFSITVDASNLTRGATTWTVHGWDSAPGSAFQNHAEVALSLTVGGPPIVVEPSPGDPGTKYVPAGYSLKFSDEFNSGSVDTGKWNTLAPWGVQFYTDSHQKQAFIPSAVTQSGGVAVFTADRSKGNTNGQPYSSGSLTTNGTFTHGYFEARVKIPQGKGYWPAFWLTSKDRWPPEWDIFEIIDDDIFGYTHPVSGGRCTWVEGSAGSDAMINIPNLFNVFHVYGFRWTETDLYWYIDGALTEHYSCNAAAGTNDPMWLNVSFQIGGDWPGDPNSSTPFPARMETDYVRVYQQ